MKSPKEYLDEVRQNLQKIQAQQQVTPTETRYSVSATAWRVWS